MTAISVRDLDPKVKELLRKRAAEHGRSMEAEVRAILTDAVSRSGPENLIDALAEFRRRSGGVDLEPLAREDPPRPVAFS